MRELYVQSFVLFGFEAIGAADGFSVPVPEHSTARRAHSADPRVGQLVKTNIHTATLGNPRDMALWRHQKEGRNVSDAPGGEQETEGVIAAD
jgi:hypothetical protein